MGWMDFAKQALPNKIKNNLLRDFQSGNKLSAAVGSLGAMMNAPEMKWSEMLRTPRTPAAETPVWQQLGYPNEDEWRLDNGLATSDGRRDPGITANLAGDQLYDPLGGDPETPGVPGSGPGAGDTLTPQPMETYPGSGVWIDVSTPEGRQSYFDARNQYALSEGMKYEEAQRNQLRLLLEQAKAEAVSQEADLNDVWQKYMSDFGTAQKNLGQTYQQGESDRLGKYTALSPNAYQSSMGTSGQFAAQQYNEAQAKQEEQKNAEMATKTRKVNELNDYYNTYEKQNELAFQDAVDSFKKSLMAQASQQGAGFASADAAAGAKMGNYNYDALKGWAPNQADISDFIPNIAFNTEYKNPLMKAAKSTVNAASTNIAPLDSYQGMTATTKEKDPLQTWLY